MLLACQFYQYIILVGSLNMPFLRKPRMELKYHRYDVPEIYVFSSYSTMQKERPIRKQILRNATNDLNMLELYMIKAMHHNIIVIQVSIQGL